MILSHKFRYSVVLSIVLATTKGGLLAQEENRVKTLVNEQIYKLRIDSFPQFLERSNFGIRAEGFYSKYTPRLFDGFKEKAYRGGEWTPGFAANIFYRYSFLGISDFQPSSPFIEIGVGYSYSRGMPITGKSTRPGDSFEILGFMENHALRVPVLVGSQIQVRNTKLFFAAGIEWFTFPDRWNKDSERGLIHSASGQNEKEHINYNYIFESGASINARFLDSIGLIYKRTRWDVMGNNNYFLGIFTRVCIK